MNQSLMNPLNLIRMIGLLQLTKIILTVKKSRLHLILQWKNLSLLRKKMTDGDLLVSILRNWSMIIRKMLVTML